MTNKCENCIASNMCEDVEGSCEKTINYANVIYNKALDDLRNELKNHYTESNVDFLLDGTEHHSYLEACNYLEDYVDEMTEKLKRGGEDERLVTTNS